MKNKLFKLLTLLWFLSTAIGCDDGGDTPAPEEELQAIIASEQQVVSPFTEVTLDGSQSTGPSGFSYEWIYEGNESVTLSSTTDPVVTFTPEKNASYVFTLRVTKSGRFSEATTSVVASDDVLLESSLFPNDSDVLRLYPGVSYVMAQDFTIPDGKTVSVQASDFVNITSENASGLIVNGTLNILGNLNINAQDDLWKGILVDGGSISSGGLELVSAGTEVFSGRDEMAAITVLNDGSLTGSYRMSRFDDDPPAKIGVLYESSAMSTTEVPTIITSKYDVPAKFPVGFLNVFAQLGPSNYEYIEVVTAGAGVTEASPINEFRFANHDYFISDGFTAGSKVLITSATLYFDEDDGMICSGNLTIASSTLKGLNDVSWKGIACTSNMQLSNSTIDGAGSSVHNTGSFTSIEKAAVYASVIASSSSALNINNSTISNSGGYGVYIPDGRFGGVQNTVFSGNTNYDLSGTVNAPWQVIVKTNNTWGSDMPVEIRGGNISNYAVSIPVLGNGESYYIDDNVNALGDLTLREGVKVKFAADKGLSVSSRFTARGTSENPIVFDGVGSTPGSWKGIELLGAYVVEYCTITNGGSSAFSGQDAANIIFGGGTSNLTAPQANFRFDHNTVSNSAGWGSQVKFLKFDPLENNNTNTFENNAIVDSDGDGIPDGDEFPGCENDPGC